MNQIIKTTITFCNAIAILCNLNLSAIAQQRWSGTGQIIYGYDEGALVELGIKVDSTGSKATIESYPSTGEEIPLNRPTQTKTGNWEIYPCNDDLCATLEQNQPSRTIYYRLNKE
jgi:hypothetical protein